MNSPVDVVEGRARRKRYRPAAIFAVAVLAIVGGTYFWWPRPEAHIAARQIAIPVTAAKVVARDVPIYLDALGTVTAANTVAIHSQVDGRLQSVNFVEGQDVRKGDVLARIDPRMFEAALEQAIAKKAEDQAQLVAAEKDLARFTALTKRNFETRQNLDLQQAKVDQFKAMIEADQAAIDSARTQLSYTVIKAPIDGRVGFRQIDAGNIIHANDTVPLTVLTQLRPVFVTFSLPQADIAQVRDAMQHGSVPVAAFNQDDTRQIAQGQLALMDNQVDQTTGTIRLKARFPNTNEHRLPGEFVHIRLLARIEKNAVTIPPPALQRGPNGFYAWVVNPDSRVAERPIDATPVGDSTVIVTKGLSPGELVVVNGQYRLQSGARVALNNVPSATTARKSS